MGIGVKFYFPQGLFLGLGDSISSLGIRTRPAQVGFDSGWLGDDPVLQDLVVRDALHRLRKPPAAVPAAVQIQLPFSVSEVETPDSSRLWQSADSRRAGSAGSQFPREFDPRWQALIPAGLMKKILRRHTKEIRLEEIEGLKPCLDRGVRDPREAMAPLCLLDWLSFRPLRPEVTERIAEHFYKLFAYAVVKLRKATERMAQQEPLFLQHVTPDIDDALSEQDYVGVIAAIVAASHFASTDQVRQVMEHPHAFVRWPIIATLVKQIPMVRVSDMWRQERPRMEIDMASHSRMRQMPALTLLGNLAQEGVPHAKTVLHRFTQSEDLVLKFLATTHYQIIEANWSSCRAGRYRLAKTKPDRISIASLWRHLNRDIKLGRWDDAALDVSRLMALKDPAIIDQLSRPPYDRQPIVEYAMLVESLANASREEQMAIWQTTKTMLLGMLSETDLETHQQIQIICDAFIREGIIEAEQVKERCFQRVIELDAKAN